MWPMYMVYDHTCVSVCARPCEDFECPVLLFASLSRTGYLPDPGARLAATNWAIFLIPSFQCFGLQAHMVTPGFLPGC